MINSNSSLLRKRDFFTAFENRNQNFTCEKWEDNQIEKRNDFKWNIKWQLNISRYLEEYTKNAEII